MSPRRHRRTGAARAPLAPLLLAVAASCGPAADDAPPGTVALDGLLNGGFEWVADGTTRPPKLGAYWVGAFDRAPDAPDDRIEPAPPRAGPQGRPEAGGHFLRLRAGEQVHQKIVADPGAALPASITLQARLAGDVRLDVVLQDGPGRAVAWTFDAATLIDATRAGRATLREAGVTIVPSHDRWSAITIVPTTRWSAEVGEPAVPRLHLRLAARGPEGASADVDDVAARLHAPALSAAELRAVVEDLVRWQLRTWLLPPEEGGLGLVDPATGRVSAAAYDVESGRIVAPVRAVSFHTVHDLLARWLRHARARGLHDEVSRWTPHLRRIVTTLLEQHFHPDTGLPRNVDAATGAPLDDSPVTVGAFVEFLLEARPLLDDDDLAARVLATCRRVADALVALQGEHDLGATPNDWSLDFDTGVLRGDFRNWHGHIPNKITPLGEIDTPRRFNTAWAVVTGRPFWYHVFKSPAAVAAVSALDPRPGDLDAVRRVVSLYHRDWDAHRYQLENDTDDHYGYLCEDVLAIVEAAGAELPEALALVRAATDHRLEPRAPAAGDTLWVQGARLGTPCAGDSPRAIEGLRRLWALPPEVDPQSAGRPLYRDAILELAANDYKGRQLVNGQFTESFFKEWEMVAICFRGNLQDDCRTPPPEGWHGDVGDTFGGPPTSAIEAQIAAWRVARPEERAELRARLTAILHATEGALRREHGYLFGLDAEVARRYELPEPYVIGLSSRSAAGLGYVLSWAKLLPYLEGDA